MKNFPKIVSARAFLKILNNRPHYRIDLFIYLIIRGAPTEAYAKLYNIRVRINFPKLKINKKNILYKNRNVNRKQLTTIEANHQHFKNSSMSLKGASDSQFFSSFLKRRMFEMALRSAGT